MGGLALSSQRQREQKEQESGEENASVGDLKSCQVVDFVGERKPDQSDARLRLSIYQPDS